ncbi:MAG: hypothetical protein LBD02_03715 [Christensenellaceae bacterium]|nr:hypothetical protein [Christensenellaceae bacterium]
MCFGETLEEAVVREGLEESSLRFRVERLAWMQECFYSLKGGVHDGEFIHQRGFYFLRKPGPEAKIEGGTLLDQASGRLEWLPRRARGASALPDAL